MGSSLGLCKALKNAGKDVKVITPDTPPKYLTFLPGADNIVVFSRHDLYANKLLADADLIFCLDYNDAKRVDLVAPALLNSQAKKVMIDHHLGPDSFPDLIISHPEISSTSVLVYRVLSAIGMLRFVDLDVATALYTGMMTDTGNFSYNSNDPELYRVVARLLEKGIDKDWIYKRVYFTNSVNRLRLNGYALCEKLEYFPNHSAALITLTRDELNNYHYQKGDTEDLVNRPLTCPDIVYSVFLREESDYIKVSSRSKGSFPVNKLCEEYFNGGGHLNAAGGEFFGTLQEAVDCLKEAMPLFDHYLPK
jgi:phosphoesterase RecJ-like protein